MSYYLTNYIAVDETEAVELLSNGRDGDQRVSLWTAPALTGATGWLFYLRTNGDPVLLTRYETAYTPSPIDWLDTLGCAVTSVVLAIEESPANLRSRQGAIDVVEQAEWERENEEEE